MNKNSDDNDLQKIIEFMQIDDIDKLELHEQIHWLSKLTKIVDLNSQFINICEIQSFLKKIKWDLGLFFKQTKFDGDITSFSVNYKVTNYDGELNISASNQSYLVVLKFAKLMSNHNLNDLKKCENHKCNKLVLGKRYCNFACNSRENAHKQRLKEKEK